MWNADLIHILGVMMVAAAVAVLLLRRLYVPSIVVYLLVGLVLGPFLGLIPTMSPGDDDHSAAEQAIHVIAETGIALLLFLVGLELSLAKIRDVGKVAVAAGLGQVVFTAIGGFAIAMLLRFTWMESLFLATALTFSSTVVVVKLLDQKKHLHALYGRIAVGIFLVQDLVVIVALTFLAGLGDGESLSAAGMTWGLALAFAGMAAMLVVAILASRFILPAPTNWAARTPGILFIWSLFWCMAFVVGAEKMGLSPEIGAFLAGLSLAQLKCSEDLRRRVHPLMNFFIAVFFVSLGAQMELGVALTNWPSAVVLSLFVLIGNPLIFMIIIARGGYSKRTSFLTSVTVAQISEFSFIFAAAGITAGLIDAPILSLIALVGLVTIITSALMILYNEPLYDLMDRFGLLNVFGAAQEEEADAFEQHDLLQDHVIIVGMNALGRELALRLHEQGETVLAIDTDRHKLYDLPCHMMVGNIDFNSMVEESNLAHAKLVVSALQIEDTNHLLAHRCKTLNVPTVIHAFERSVIDGLRREKVAYRITMEAIVANCLESKLREEGVVPA